MGPAPRRVRASDRGRREWRRPAPACHRAPLRINGDARQVLALRTDDIHLASIGDDRLGGYLATRKLIDQGHTRIGLVMGPEYATTAVHRRHGYREALTEAGIPLDDCLIAGDGRDHHRVLAATV